MSIISLSVYHVKLTAYLTLTFAAKIININQEYIIQNPENIERKQAN